MNPQRKRIGLITFSGFPNLYEDDLAIKAELEARGHTAVPVVWSDQDVDWSGFALLVMRSPWDYFQRTAEFRAWLSARKASGVPMCNSISLIEWNFDKSYLAQLADAGVPIIPTVFIARGDKPDLKALAEARGWKEVVVKPTISGGAYRTHRLTVESLGTISPEIDSTLQSCGLLMQPFLPEIMRDGELSMIFFDGLFSHAIHKLPKAGDYRVQVQFGATSEPYQPSPELLEQARKCIAAAPELPVYARVDGVMRDGKFLLMELEAFEPLLSLVINPGAARRFADALLRHL